MQLRESGMAAQTSSRVIIEMDESMYSKGKGSQTTMQY